MVWSQEDFVREVRRQLIELESLRKKIRAKADVTECIERLEESHHYLLRKLDELAKSESAAAGGVPFDDSPANLPKPVQAYLQSILGNPGVLQHLSNEAGEHGEFGAAVVILSLGGAQHIRTREGSEDGFGQPYSLN